MQSRIDLIADDNKETKKRVKVIESVDVHNRISSLEENMKSSSETSATNLEHIKMNQRTLENVKANQRKEQSSTNNEIAQLKKKQ